MEVGLRELKNHLGRYMQLVRGGESVVITDRGKPIARIQPVPPADLPPRLQQLIAEGRVTYRPGPPYIPRPIPVTPGEKTIADYIVEQRDYSLRRFERPDEAPGGGDR